MFGYVIADLSALSDQERQRYQSAYCGLCRTLRRSYGLHAALTLSYELTFLTMLLSSLYEPEEQSGTQLCLVHPGRPKPWVCCEITDYAAAMNCLLAYFKCEDDWRDDRALRGAAGMAALRKAAAQASARYPRQSAAISDALARIARAEREEAGPEEPARAFGSLMAELFVLRQDRWEPVLRRFGEAFGEFLYDLDAACDLREDLKRGRYNPLPRMGVTRAEDFRPQLTMLIADAAEAFEALPLVQDAAILRNILYSGIWSQYARRLQEVQA